MRLLVPGTSSAFERHAAPEQVLTRPLDPGHSLTEFAINVGAPLADHQAEALKLEKRITAIVAPRQAGKSRSTAVLALHRAVEVAGLSVLIIAADDAGAQRLLGTIRDLAVEADPDGARLAREPTKRAIWLTNGSVIRCVPPTQRRIRGWSVDLLIVDEASLVADDIILSAALPTTNSRPGSRIVLVSSPLSASGVFYRFVTEGEQGSSTVAAARWKLPDSPWIDPEIVAIARRNMPPAQFAAEYLAEFSDSGLGVLIPRSWIEAAQRRDLVGRARGAFGVDVARSGSDWTTIYRQRGGVVRELERVNGRDTMGTANAVAARMMQAPDVPAVVDVIGIGAGVFDRLAELGLRAVPFNAGSKAFQPKMFTNRRAEVYWRLRRAFEEGEVDLDAADHELADELAALRFETVTGGRTAMESKDSIRARGLKSPDRADAIVMAVSAEPVDLAEKGPLGERRHPKAPPPSKPDGLRLKRGDVAKVRKGAW